MIPRLYLALGLVAALALGGLALYAKGRVDARHAAETSLLRSQIKTLEDAYRREQRARQLDSRQALSDAKDADLDATAGKEFIDEIEDPDGDVLGARDADRLRDFFAGGAAAPK